MQREFPKLEKIVSEIHSNELFAVYPDILAVLIAGSSVTGLTGWWSDIDLFFYLDEESEILCNTDLRYEFLTTLGIQMDKIFPSIQVQISIFNTLPLLVQSRVLQKHRIIYQKHGTPDELIPDLIVKILPQAFDFSIAQQRWFVDANSKKNDQDNISSGI